MNFSNLLRRVLILLLNLLSCVHKGVVNDDVAGDKMTTVNDENLNSIVLPRILKLMNIFLKKPLPLSMLLKKILRLLLSLNSSDMGRLMLMLR